jgi:hypothetical protein
MNYDVDYFINKFTKIPEQLWQTMDYGRGETCCAMGYCGAKSAVDLTDEARALEDLLGGHYKPQSINDGCDPRYLQGTPKQRILAALYDIKKMQTKNIDTGGKVKTVYVSVPTTVIEQAKELVMS